MSVSKPKSQSQDALLLIAALAAATASIALLLWCDSNFKKPLQLLSPADISRWSRVISLRDNTYFFWPTADVNGLAQLIFGTAGLMVLGLLAGRGAAIGFSTAVTVVMLSLAILGMDIPLAYCGASFLWIWAGLENFRRSPTRQNGALLVLVSILILPSCHQAAPLVWIAGLICAHRSETPGWTTSEQRLTLLTSIAISWLTLLSIPTSKLTQYPPAARLVPVSALGDAGALFGPAAGLVTADPAALNPTLLITSLLLALISLGLFTAASRNVKQLSLTAAALFAGTAINAAPWRELREIGPYAALSRIVPYAAGFNLGLLGLLLGILTLAVALMDLRHARSIIGMLLLCAFLLAGCRIYFNQEALLVPKFAHRAWNEIKDRPSDSATLALNSPSALLLNLYGSGPYLSALNFGDHKASRLSSLKPTIRGSHSETSLGGLTDRVLQSGWSTGKSGQSGDEWLFVELQKRVAWHGLDLKLSKDRAAEFPRGLRISYAEDCAASCLHRPEQSCTDKRFLRLLVDIPSWQGPIKLTPEGLPFFGPQPEVRVYFPTIVEPGCLLIEQTGTDPYNPWSISEINVLIRK
ncbi:MAG: hypothetical protein K1X83_06615 [Oligoflexia bacterium]|nr:hypothetical protein [Oligoflexia bacterium]